MAHPTFEDARRLSDWEPELGVVSVYLAFDPADRGGAWRTELRNGLDALLEAAKDADHERRVALRAVARRITERFEGGDHRPPPRGAAGFVEVAEKGGEEHWWGTGAAPQSNACVELGERPTLAPLVVGLPVELDPPVAANPWSAVTGPVVGFVGRLEPRKGVHDLLAAVPAIRTGSAGSAVVLIGDDPYGSAPEYTAGVLADAAALGVEHHRWHANAPGLMRHLDVLVLPSYSEPFGTVLAEAMAVGTPVVATAVDGLVEVVDDGVTGRLVPPGDPVRLAAAVLEVLAQREPMSRAARQRAARWGTPAYVERIEALLSAPVGGRR